MKEFISSWLGIIISTGTILGTLALGGWYLYSFVDGVNRKMAWMTYAQATQTATALRNRVNDCDIRTQQPPPMSKLEHDACSQYRDEFNEANRKMGEAHHAAMEASK